MSLRFRKSFKLAPDLPLNMSKSGRFIAIEPFVRLGVETGPT
jgi:hypothetical protein